MARLLLLTIFLIVYGCLYPWEFRPRSLSVNPVMVVAASWTTGTTRRFLLDSAINIALFLPLGILTHLVLARRYNPFLGLVVPVILGFLLSLGVETAQVFTPRRNPNALDVIANTIGAALGGILAIGGREVLDVLPVRRGSVHRANRGAMALLFCWLAFLFFPFVPEVSLPILRHKLVVFIDPGRSALLPFLFTAIAWFIAGRLLAAASVRSVKWLGIGVSFAIPLQLLVDTRQPTLSHYAGAITGFLLFAFCGDKLKSRKTDAWVVMLLLWMRGLSPFNLAISPNSFSWLPFGGVLELSWQYGLVILFEKVFYYGTAIWALQQNGMRLVNATVITATTLGCLEAIQIYLRDRTPEITDVLLALLIGVTVSVFRERP